MADIAVGYASKGWPVFPLKPGEKTPATAHGFKDATCDAGQLLDWWDANPDCNVGIPTGISFDVLDLDGPGAEAAITDVFHRDGHPGEYLIGPTVSTPRGYHLYVAPTGNGNTVNLGGLPGVDWRGQGGYVVAPGSRRADGAEWCWEFPDDPLYGPDASIRPVPGWLLDLLTKPTVVEPSYPARREPGGATAYVRAALERAVGRLASAPVGGRNDTLNREAHGLGRLVGAGLLTASEAGNALLAVALRIGLDKAEAVATIRSGLIAGKNNPARVAA